MSKPLILIGAGDHALVVADSLALQGRIIHGFVTEHDPAEDSDLRRRLERYGWKWIGKDDALSSYSSNEYLLVNCVGSIASPDNRAAVYLRFKRLGFDFERVIHPSAVVAPSVVLGEGCQVMAGAVIQAGAIIGADVIVNTRAGIDHDGVIGDHSHVAPGATLCGGVRVGEMSHLGAGCLVRQRVQIGSHALVAMGAVVVADVPSFAKVRGVPAKVY